MSKTSEAIVFRAHVPFALFDTDTYASKYGRSEVIVCLVTDSWLDTGGEVKNDAYFELEFLGFQA